jgi:hypothetical protein
LKCDVSECHLAELRAKPLSTNQIVYSHGTDGPAEDLKVESKKFEVEQDIVKDVRWIYLEGKEA